MKRIKLIIEMDVGEAYQENTSIDPKDYAKDFIYLIQCAPYSELELVGVNIVEDD